MKGIVLADGRGARLHPVTLEVSQQLLPVYDKPMIYYSLSVLMMSGITDIRIVAPPRDAEVFARLLGDGSSLGIRLGYADHDASAGAAGPFLAAADHVGDDSVALVRGDNIFHGEGLGGLLRRAARDVEGCVLFGHPSRNPDHHDVAGLDDRGRLVTIHERRERPERPTSDLAITGLAFYDASVLEVASRLRAGGRAPSAAELNRVYVERGEATLVPLGRGFVWLEAGTGDALMDAGRYVKVLQDRQQVRIACLEVVAWRMGYIDRDACYRLGSRLAGSDYGRYVMAVAAAG